MMTSRRQPAIFPGRCLTAWRTRFRTLSAVQRIFPRPQRPIWRIWVISRRLITRAGTCILVSASSRWLQSATVWRCTVCARSYQPSLYSVIMWSLWQDFLRSWRFRPPMCLHMTVSVSARMDRPTSRLSSLQCCVPCRISMCSARRTQPKRSRHGTLRWHLLKHRPHSYFRGRTCHSLQAPQRKP